MNLEVVEGNQYTKTSLHQKVQTMHQEIKMKVEKEVNLNEILEILHLALIQQIQVSADLQINISHDNLNLSGTQEQLRASPMLRFNNLKKTRPVTAKTSPQNIKHMQGNFLHQDISDINIRTVKRNKAVFYQNSNLESSAILLDQQSNMNMSQTLFHKKPISNDTRSNFSISPSKFKIQKNVHELTQSLDEDQIKQIFEAKLKDNHLPYQDKSFNHFYYNYSNEGPNKNILGPKGAFGIKDYFIKKGINVRGNLFDKKGLINLIRRAPRTLKELDISDNDIKDKGITAFAEILYNHNHGNVGSDSDDEVSKDIFSKENTQRLKSIKILDDEFDPDNLPSLSYLNISKCGISWRGLDALTTRLMMDGSLRTLILDQNNFEGKGFLFFERFLVFNNSIEKLSMNECHVNDELAIQMENLKIKQNDIFLEGGQYLAHSMLDNRQIKTIQAENNVFYIKYVDKMKEYSKRNYQTFLEQQFPRFIEEKERLSKIKAQKGVFHMLKTEVEKEDRKMHDKLKKTLKEFEEFKKYEQTRYQYLLEKAQSMKDLVKQKQKDYVKACDREKYLEIHGEKQIRELIHFSDNFEKDKDYIQDDINYRKGKAREKRSYYNDEIRQLNRTLNEQQEKLNRAFLACRAQENELASFIKKNQYRKQSTVRIDGARSSDDSGAAFKRSPTKRGLSSKTISRRSSQISNGMNQDMNDMMKTQDINDQSDFNAINEQQKKKKKKGKSRNRKKKNNDHTIDSRGDMSSSKQSKSFFKSPIQNK
ncbi:UNKNOWN [Stylonychia lemnae]|uniref:Leucine rich repeat family protein n=1 Tax=Stylonychia lemnae TaxID=5949 RepID=A0A078B4A9_STYLE|nr:UNKNOWN [Stylonychia lemnae]|eukprot:CDW89309.1 UNKNOWN [Stylonychia lemnae]